MAGAAASPLVLDAVVGADSIDDSLIAELRALAPFGEGNPEPLFGLCGARLVTQRLVGTGHLKLSVEAGGRAFQAIGFGMDSLLPEGARSVDLAFTPEHNTYNGITSIQLRLRETASLP
jgi:single-stranded-DNA-specific exonuclease